MDLGTALFRDQRIGRLLDPVVQEYVSIVVFVRESPRAPPSSIRIGPSSCRARSAWARRPWRSRRPMTRGSSNDSARAGGSSSISNPCQTPTACCAASPPISASPPRALLPKSRRKSPPPARRADAGDPRQSGDALAQGHGGDRSAARATGGDRGAAARHHHSRRHASSSRPRRAHVAGRRTARRSRRARSVPAPCGFPEQIGALANDLVQTALRPR